MVDKDWVRIYSSDKPYQVEIIKSILEENSIPSFEVNKKDSSYNMFGEVELYVGADDAALAKIILEQNPL